LNGIIHLSNPHVSQNIWQFEINYRVSYRVLISVRREKPMYTHCITQEWNKFSCYYLKTFRFVKFGVWQDFYELYLINIHKVINFKDKNTVPRNRHLIDNICVWPLKYVSVRQYFSWFIILDFADNRPNIMKDITWNSLLTCNFFCYMLHRRW
jgi:hypothetical protein